MFSNNKVMNELYNKINEYKALKSETYAKRNFYYLIIAIVSLSSLILISQIGLLDNNVMMQGLTALIYTPILAFSLIFATYKGSLDPGYWFWPKSNKVLAKNKQAIIDYITKEETQIEILNFKFGSLSEATVNELKKSLALKEYSNAYTKLFGMLNSMVYLENAQLTESQTKKLIAEYELDLKMKL